MGSRMAEPAGRGKGAGADRCLAPIGLRIIAARA